MDELLKFAESQGFIVKEKPLKAFDGLTDGKRIAIRDTIQNTDQKKYILAHELAHAFLHKGDTIDSPYHDFYEWQADKGAELILKLMEFMKGEKQ